MQNSRLASDSFPGLLNEMRAASTAGGGTALTTTAAIIGFIQGTSHVGLNARNFATAVVAKVLLNPYLLVLKSADGGQTVTDFSAALQVNPATTGMALGAMATLANGGALYIGSHVQFRGFAVVMSGSVNANASVMKVEYWNGTAWTAVTGFTDGTASAGATFAVSGNVVYTVPTDWTKVQLSQTQNPPPSNPPVTPTQVAQILPYNDKAQYWLRVSVSAALSATVKPNTIFSLNRSTAYVEMTEGSFLQFRTTDRRGSTACVEVLTDAGTANLIVNCYTDNPLGVFQ